MASDAETALFEYISGVTAVADLVGSESIPRATAEVDYPRSFIFGWTRPRFPGLQWPGGPRASAISIRFLEKYADLPAIALQLRLALDGLSQTVGGFTLGAYSSTTSTTSPSNPRPKPISGFLDFIVWHNE